MRVLCPEARESGRKTLDTQRERERERERCRGRAEDEGAQPCFTHGTLPPTRGLVHENGSRSQASNTALYQGWRTGGMPHPVHPRHEVAGVRTGTRAGRGGSCYARLDGRCLQRRRREEMTPGIRLRHSLLCRMAASTRQTGVLHEECRRASSSQSAGRCRIEAGLPRWYVRSSCCGKGVAAGRGSARPGSRPARASSTKSTGRFRSEAGFPQ